jgi:hypothetical protein
MSSIQDLGVAAIIFFLIVVALIVCYPRKSKHGSTNKP